MRRRLLMVGVPLAVLGALYIADLITTTGKVPRGVTASGVPIGGLTPDGAEQRLREQLTPRQTQPVPVRLGPVDDVIDPQAVGVSADPAATVAQVDGQPWNPVTRLMSFFVPTPVEVVSTVDNDALAVRLDELGRLVAEDPVEGSVVFVDGQPVSSDPRSGQRLDVEAAAQLFTRDWSAGAPIDLPVVAVPADTTSADVEAAVSEIAAPAVSGPVIINGDNNTRAVISADTIASALTFRVEDGSLEPEMNDELIVSALRPQLAASEVAVREADIDFAVSPPVKMPERNGRRVDYPDTLEQLRTVLADTEDREMDASYRDEEAEYTLAMLEELGPIEVIGEFQTSGFAWDSGRNIRRAAEQINGIVVAPGEIFSLNGATNPRNAASGYVDAGIIQHGRPARGVGGGVSQLATTLFNAAYFAGMEDIEHHEHSYYISRYPAGREATVFADVLDVKFRNDGPTSVQIQTEWTSSAVTVRIVGIKRYEVSSEQSARSRPTSPSTITIPAGEACSASGGGSGFTITDTRTLRDITTGDTRTESHTVTYDPIPRVICGG